MSKQSKSQSSTGIKPLNLKTEVFSIGKTSSIYMLGRVLSQGVGFLMIPIYTRFLSPMNYGVMEMIGILTAIVSMILLIGVSDGMSRFYYSENSKAEKNKVVSTIIIGFSIIGIPITLFFLFLSEPIASILLDDFQYATYLQISLISVWFGMLREIGFNYLRLIYKAKLFIFITTLELLLSVSLNIIFIVYLNLNILGVFYSSLICSILFGTTLSLSILRFVGLKVSFPLLKQIISFGLPLIPARIGLFIGFVSNRFFLRWMGSPDPSIALAQIGIYTLGHKFGVIVNRFVNAPFNSFWGPRRIELLLSPGSDTDSRKIISKICTYSTMLSFYVALLLSSGIKSVIEIMADPSYTEAYLVVPLVALSYVALGLESHFSTGIIICKRTIWSTYTTFLSLIVILIWNYIFVPIYGILGAATSNLAGFSVRIIVLYFASQKLFLIPFELKRLLILLISSIFVFTISQLITFYSPILTFIFRSLFVLFFPLYLFIFRFYRKGEIMYAKESISNIISYISSFRVFSKFFR